MNLEEMLEIIEKHDIANVFCKSYNSSTELHVDGEGNIHIYYYEPNCLFEDD